MADEFAWVIERHYNSVLTYWTGKGGADKDFSADNLRALRFSRRCDAEIVLVYLLGGIGNITEHGWMEQQPPASQQAREWTEADLRRIIFEAWEQGPDAGIAIRALAAHKVIKLKGE